MTPIQAAGRDYRAFFQALDPAALWTLARAKRFVENWLAFPALRERIRGIARDGGTFDAVCRDYGLEVDPGGFVPFLNIAGAHRVPHDPPQAVRLWFDYRRHLVALRAAVAQAGDTGGVNPRFDRWRQRQMRRSQGALGKAADFITHPVIAFELSEGCSIGCWFCGISASRFAGHWPYQEHALEWQAILDRTVAFFGPAAGTGFCYWGTDPSDNPDYTDFVVDFVRATGMVPMTTTAAPLRDLPMVRRIIALADRNQGLPNRFSILTPRQLQDLFMVFSPDELLHVDLVLHMRGSLQPKSVAGRARSRRAAIADSATIACVSGFLVNLPRRHVRLVTPVPSSVAEPDGFRVLGEADFTDPASFGAVLQDLADRHMVQGLRHDDKLRLRPEVEYAPTADGFVLTQGKFHHTVSGDIAARLGRSLSDGGHTVGDVCAAPETDFRTLLEMSRTVETLFDAGLLREPDERAQAA